ncbi:MAG: TRAP transporter small permease [Pseudomonadota bacterium]
MSLDRLQTLWQELLKTLLVVMVGLLLAIMMAQVVMRYGFNNSLIWAEEICRYLLIWMSMLALMFAYERGEIASVRIALYALPRRAGFVVAVVGNILAAGLCFLLVYYGFKYASIAGSQPVPALRFIFSDLFGEAAVPVPAMFWVYAVLPVGMGLLGVRIVSEAIACVHASRGTMSLSDYHNRYGGGPA